MLDKPLKDETIADVQALVDANVGESQRLEHKVQLLKTGSDGLREFCKDVTAMANAQGGDILFGVRESNGAAGAAHSFHSSSYLLYLPKRSRRSRTIATRSPEPAPPPQKHGPQQRDRLTRAVFT
jgi:hypothetical protein